ncbi:bcl-2-like protein 10 [Osmerus eperlanus]|uniref:Anti-apoptotic protein NR13 n=1 Tax=Osmerus mordax TaxID=8014 RepID=C1BL36_OSMMO|nr:Anti-apoptotic protein NR13 [Osmerus mordax]
MSCRLWKETLALGEDYLAFCCASPRLAPPPPSEPAAAMRRLAQDMETLNSVSFQALSKNLLCHSEQDPCASLRAVLKEIVVDGKLNWGRVVCIFTFTGVLARQLQEQKSKGQDIGQGPDKCRGLAEAIADFLGEEKKDWLQENGGWEGLCKFSDCARGMNQDSSMKTALFAVAGVGIAGLTFLLGR